MSDVNAENFRKLAGELSGARSLSLCYHSPFKQPPLQPVTKVGTGMARRYSQADFLPGRYSRSADRGPPMCLQLTAGVILGKRTGFLGLCLLLRDFDSAVQLQPN